MSRVRFRGHIDLRHHGPRADSLHHISPYVGGLATRTGAVNSGVLIRESPYVLKCLMAAASWTFLSNHGHVLVQLARGPDTTMREIAHLVGLTERAVQLIVRDLADEGYITIQRVGRRNSYTLTGSLPLRHPAEQETTVGDLISILDGQPTAGGR